MLGGAMTGREASPLLAPLADAAGRAAAARNPQEAQTVRGHRRAGGRALVLGGELAGDALPAAYGALRNDQGTTRLAGDQQQTQCRSQSARGIPRPDDDGRLPRGAADVDAVRALRLRRADRRVHRAWWCRMPTTRRTARIPPVAVEAVGGAYGSGGWFHRDDFPKMASVEAAAEMWSRTDLTRSDVDVAEIYDGFTFLTFAWLEALGFCARRRGRAVRRRARRGSRSTASFR